MNTRGLSSKTLLSAVLATTLILSSAGTVLAQPDDLSESLAPDQAISTTAAPLEGAMEGDEAAAMDRRHGMSLLIIDDAIDLQTAAASGAAERETAIG